jgi:hypothetical protein
MTQAKGKPGVAQEALRRPGEAETSPFPAYVGRERPKFANVDPRT